MDVATKVKKKEVARARVRQHSRKKLSDMVVKLVHWTDTRDRR